MEALSYFSTYYGYLQQILLYPYRIASAIVSPIPPKNIMKRGIPIYNNYNITITITIPIYKFQLVFLKMVSPWHRAWRNSCQSQFEGRCAHTSKCLLVLFCSKVSKLVLFIVTVLPYGGHDGDGEEKCVGEGPLIAPALHLGFIFFLFPLFFHPFPSDYRGFLWPFLVHTVLLFRFSDRSTKI